MADIHYFTTEDAEAWIDEFPLRVLYKDSDTPVIVRRPEDFRAGVSFLVLAIAVGGAR